MHCIGLYMIDKYLLFSLFFTVLGVAQHQDKVDFIRASILVQPLPLKKQIKGDVSYEFEVLANVDSVFLDAHNMDFEKVYLDNAEVPFSNDGKTITIKKSFKKRKAHQLQLEYVATPKQTVYFVGNSAPLSDQMAVAEHSRSQIWTQGQGKYTSHWLPSFDAMEEKVEFDLNIKTPAASTVIANGKLVRRQKEKDSLAIWKFDMKQPMSSYLLAFVIGNYSKQELVSNSGIPIENYFYPRDSLRVEPTYRYTKEIFDFLETEIGVAYPWQNYKQVPVHDFLYAGMENTGATIFSDGFMIDSTAFVDKNYVNVNAHELAHQWFGNLVTEKDGNHHWLHEGFATYYAYLAEKEIFGDEHFYWKLYDKAQQLQGLSERGEGEALLNPKASSLTFYEKGAWALVALRNMVGDDAFRRGIIKYLKKYQYKNATVAQFLQEMEEAGKKDLSAFSTKWLEGTEYPMTEVKSMLKSREPSLALLFEMEGRIEDAQSKDIVYESYWDATISVHFKKHLLQNFQGNLSISLIQKAFETDAITIRQALAASPLDLSSSDTLNKEVKHSFESLLADRSYVTQELALIKLWSTFEKDRSNYLDQLEGIQGLPNKNVRLLWLTLALVTPDYRIADKPVFFKELSFYTGSSYNPELRQTAFQYLNDIGALNEEVFRELIKATNHHSWQFRSFARRLLDELWKDEGFKIQLQEIAKGLKEDDLRYLNTKLNLE